jgi:hypothetical protein
MTFLEFPRVPVACMHSFTASWRAPPSVANSFWYSIITQAVSEGSSLMAGGSVVAILCDDVRAAKAAVLGAMKAVVLVANSAMDIILRNFILFSVLCVESMVWYDSEDEGGLIDI